MDDHIEDLVRKFQDNGDVEDAIESMWEEFSLRLPSDIGGDAKEEFCQMMREIRKL